VRSCQRLLLVCALFATSLVGACASQSSQQITHQALTQSPLTKLIEGVTAEDTGSAFVVWYLWNDIADPNSELSVESKIRRASLNSAGHDCKDYNARGAYLTRGLFYELASPATGAETTPRGDCSSISTPPRERTNQIAHFGEVAIDKVREVATRMGFSCSPTAENRLDCSAEFIERQTIRNSGAPSPEILQIDYQRAIALTYEPGHPASVTMSVTRIGQ